MTSTPNGPLGGGKRRRERETAEAFEADRQAVRTLANRRFDQAATVRHVVRETVIHRSTAGRLHTDWARAKARQKDAPEGGP